MAEAFYRLKSAGGAWTRVTGAAPITVTGLTEGAAYEYLRGDGTIGEVTAGATATAIPPTFDTQPSITGTIAPGETVTLNEGTFSGTTPITITFTLTLDGVDVTADVASNSYTIPTGTAGQSLVYAETASNGIAPDATQSVTESVTEAVAANFDSINADGWSATYTNPPSFDPENSPEEFTVTRQGFDATGSATTFTENLVVMKRVRNSYPNIGTLTADKVSLSDFVYSGDTVAGATNNSTLTPPKPICMWLDHDRQRTKTGSYTAKLAVAHRHARNGRPVVAVKFIATDGTNTVEETVSTMTTESYTASGLSNPYYSATLDFSTLNDDEIITIDAVIYPWIGGTSYQASVDFATYPSINFCEMYVLNDVNFGTAYIYVDPVNGDNATAVVSENPVTAAANPAEHIRFAAGTLRAYNNANYGRDSTDGGIIRLVEATHNFRKLDDVSRVPETVPLIIEAADSSKKSTTILRDPVSNAFDELNTHVKFADITIEASNRTSFLDSGATVGSANMIACESVTFSAGGSASFFAGTFSEAGRVWLIDCTTDAPALTDLNTGDYCAFNLIGCSGPGITGSAVYNFSGTKNMDGSVRRSGFSGGEDPVGTYWGHSFISSTTSSPVVNIAPTIGPEGHAIVQTTFEHPGGTQPAMAILADGNTNTAENIFLHNVTVSGQRTNYLYNDAGNYEKVGYIRNSVFSSWNSKSDVFATDGTATGNWTVIHHVGTKNTSFLNGDSKGSTDFGAGNWIGEVQPLNSNAGFSTSLNPDFVDAANGDYSPGASTEIVTVEAGDACYPIDLLGRTIADDGTARAGSHGGTV